MDAVTTEMLVDMALPVIFYFIVGTLGAFTKDMYETMTGKIEKIRLGQIIVGGVVTVIICYGLNDTWFKDFSLNTMFLVTFIIGVLGFELFGNMTTIANIQNLMVIISEVRKGITADNSRARPPDRGTSQDIENNTSNEDGDDNAI